MWRAGGLLLLTLLLTIPALAADLSPVPNLPTEVVEGQPFTLTVAYDAAGPAP